MHYLPNHLITLDVVSLASRSVQDVYLGVIFDQDFPFKAHMNQPRKTTFFHQCNISKIKNILFLDLLGLAVYSTRQNQQASPSRMNGKD